MKNLLHHFERFIKHETSSSILLLMFTIAALVLANTTASEWYYNLFHHKITIGFNDFILSKSLILWINDGLMAIFFFVIGLEIKREVLIGELSDIKKASLPIFAAIGGIIFPIIAFKLLNTNAQAENGWAISMATDIAFTLGVLKLLGNKIPKGLILFLAAFAIVDDLGSIIVIALFYTSYINWNLILIIALIIIALSIISKLGYYSKFLFFIVFFIVWVLMLKSGIHATIAGVLMAMTIPLKKKIKKEDYYFKISEILSVFKNKKTEKLTKEETEVLNEIEVLTINAQCPLHYLEHHLHSWVAFLIMPIFAFANAGVNLSTESFTSLSLTIAISLLLGKTLGVFLFSYIALKLKISEIPKNVNLKQIFGVSVLGGLGFTMALFIVNLSYDNEKLIEASKIGILFASIIAGIIGYFIIKSTLKNQKSEE